MNCWKCGANNADDCMFCEECGADLRKPPVPPAPNPAQTAGAAPPVPPAPNPAQPVGAPQGQPAASAGQTVTVSIPNPKRMMPFAMRALQFLKQHLLAVILLLVVLAKIADGFPNARQAYCFYRFYSIRKSHYSEKNCSRKARNKLLFR